MLRDLGPMQLNNKMDEIYNSKNEKGVNSFSTGSDIMYCGMWLQVSKQIYCSIFYPVGRGIMFIQNIKEYCTISLSQLFFFNPFQSNFSANRTLPSSYLFWAVKRLVDYL
jgi:hypothetical protein